MRGMVVGEGGRSSGVLLYYDSIRICNNKCDFETATGILCDSLKRRNYSPRFLRHIKSTTLHTLVNGNRKEATSACLGLKCGTCAYIAVFKPQQGLRERNPSKLNDCGTMNVVYLISCTRCSAKYVGETGNTLRTRMNQHTTRRGRQPASNAGQREFVRQVYQIVCVLPVC